MAAAGFSSFWWANFFSTQGTSPTNVSTLLLSGNYTCEVEWDGSPISITHKLTVLVPPSIEAVLPGGLGQVDHPIEAREGSQVRLECRAEGIPPPIVRWRSPVSSKELQSISIWYVVAAGLGTIILWHRGKRAFLLCKKEATFNNCGLFELLLETFTLCGAFLHCYSRFGSRSIITLKKEPPCYYYNLVALWWGIHELNDHLFVTSLLRVGPLELRF